MSADYDKSLDDIIKLRNIRSSITPKIGGGQKWQSNLATSNRPISNVKGARVGKNAVVGDARNKLLMKQKVKMKDAREKLNERARMTDARAKLNKLGVQQRQQLTNRRLNTKAGVANRPVQLSRFKVTKSSSVPAILTRTVKNQLRQQGRPGAKTKSSILRGVGVLGGEEKRVFLTSSGLTINKPVTQTTNNNAPPSNLFVRTVNSLAHDAVYKTGPSKAPILSQKKRQLMDEEDDDLDYFSMNESQVDLKRWKSQEDQDIGMVMRRKVALVSKISPGLQSRLGDSDAGVPLQGFKILVSNLHEVVTRHDLVELFGSIGSLQRVQLVGLGTAEVVFEKLIDAKNAIETYHKRELDGQPMICKLVTTVPAQCTSVIPGSSGIRVGTLRSDHIEEVRAKARIDPAYGAYRQFKNSAQNHRTSVIFTT